MKRTDRDTQQLEQLLDRFRFTQPVPPGVRADILASKKRAYLRVLRTAGAYSALQGVFASIYFTAKKYGLALFAARVLVSAAAVLAVSVGGYYAATALMERLAGDNAEETAGDAGKSGGWVDEILLFDGRTVRGAIMSRGENYTVRTERGVITIPLKQIRAVRPLAGGKKPQK